jgi:hypothetical protein
VNRGVERLARMKGEAPRAHHQLWAEIFNRLPIYLQNLEFIQKSDNAVILMTGNLSSSGLVPSIRKHGSLTPTVIQSAAATLPRNLDIEIL